MQRYPLPPKKGAKKEEKKAPAGPPEPKIPDPLSVEKAYSQATTWNNASNIGNKHSVGTLTTVKYHEKVNVFEKMNQKVSEVSPMYPQQSYFGKTPDPSKDPYDRRKVK